MTLNPCYHIPMRHFLTIAILTLCTAAPHTLAQQQQPRCPDIYILDTHPQPKDPLAAHHAARKQHQRINRLRGDCGCAPGARSRDRHYPSVEHAMVGTATRLMSIPLGVPDPYEDFHPQECR